MELEREEIDNRCGKCDYTFSFNNEFVYCEKYVHPEAMWTRKGGCPIRTHGRVEKTESGKVLNALKKSKRQAQGRL